MLMKEGSHDSPNVIVPVEEARKDDALAFLREYIPLQPVFGERSTAATLRFAEALACDDLALASRWMTEHSIALGGTPTEIAEGSEEGLRRVLKLISQIEHGVYI